MAYIVETQQDFLEKSVEYLNPMTMEEVGNAIGVDGSTVSRAQQGQYVQTPGGILSMRSFFTRTMDTHNGPDVSTAAVKKRLEDLIGAEVSHKLLSDEKLTVLPKMKGSILNAALWLNTLLSLISLPPLSAGNSKPTCK